MPAGFGVPPKAKENRQLVEERVQEARAGQGVPETLTIEFRGLPKHVEVIDMPVTQLYYNPGTHRVRAQRSHDLLKDRALQDDPWSEESQDYLEYLLAATPADPSKPDPKFDELLESLREYKQNEPGLITRDGVLVNGNTRQAALKKLGVPSIRVGVLPASSTWDDVQAVELSLQLRPDRRRDYSYVNHLLALDEQVEAGRQLAEIAKNFQTTVPACERDGWILGQLRELIRRSENGNLALRLMDFENAKERLFELYRAYAKEYSKNKEQADLLREARLSAIVLGFAKTDVRCIESDFQVRFLDKRLPEYLQPTVPEAPAALKIPGLNRTVQAASPKVSIARALTDSVLKAKAVQVMGGQVPAEQLAEASEKISELEGVFEEAIEYAGKFVRERKKRLAAPDRVNDACKDLEQCITDLVLARGNNSLDEGAFDDALLNLRTILGRLSKEAAKSVQLPEEGVAWLRNVAAVDQ
ncbi:MULTISPECIES: transcriptional regulator [unclassified Crossiella]|uniref:transcriptional regulator n=1 Tax=unclassified Crossiella TaxID=2620835 RepID=UPI001FFF7850|nr:MULTISPECIES: transcriptional regulator [unclassified Crossiella]MCK2237154.1 transcriptional regulator [Crossiella sp. S99.2]MCK2250822.1 transcriptional regulator [Crossiella sp. S99.1]